MLLGTWNLENLYRPGGPFGPEDEAAYESKLAALAAVVTELDPVLLGVQEVGAPGALEDLAGLLDDDWHIALPATPGRRPESGGPGSADEPPQPAPGGPGPPPVARRPETDDPGPVARARNAQA